MEKAIPIQSNEGSHFGFMLVANNESNQGECVFSILPKDAESFDDPQFQFLQQFGVKESGEHQWKKNEEMVSIRFSTGDEATINLQTQVLDFGNGTTYKIKTN